MHLHGNVHTQELHLSTRRGWSARQGKRLEVSEPHALAPSLILSHEINEASPLHGVKDADIRAADAQMRGAGADLGAAIAARLPSLVLSAQAGGSSPNFADMFASGNPFWALIGGIAQPIFHGGTLRHQQRAAAAALDGAKAQYRSAVLQAFADVSDALTGLRTDADLLDAATRASKAASLSLTYGRRQLALGGIGTLTLLNASAADAQASASLVQAKAARLTDMVALYQAVGGGIDESPRVSAP